MPIIKLDLQQDSYEIHIEQGLLKNIGGLLSKWYGGNRIAVITDSTVHRLHSSTLDHALRPFQYELCHIVIEPGEQSKSLSNLNHIYSKLAEHNIDRNSLIIAFGGGVVGDLSGFAAATFMRGVPYVQIPTTIMSQLDSSIGGKTAINIEAGKNLAGCFYQPKAVYIDTLLLDTLPQDVYCDCLAEAIKYGAIKDQKLFEVMLNSGSLQGIQSQIDDIIYKCCSIKSRIVQADVLDRGDRMLLNFGHTIGHGIEKYFDFGRYTHGEAVAIGMNLITKNSERLGLTQPGTAGMLQDLISLCDLPTEISNLDYPKLFSYICLDKKSNSDQIKLILLNSIGKSFIHSIPKQELFDFIQ